VKSRWNVRLFVALIAVLLALNEGAVPLQSDGPPVTREILVRFHDDPSATSVRKRIPQASGVGYNDTLGIWRIVVPGSSTVEDALGGLQRLPQVELVQPNYSYANADAPNDPLYSESQHPYYAAINAPAAWDLETGSRDVIVAVLDDGVDIDHPELDAQIWRNPAEFENGLDDDGNGCIDDINGCNVLNDPPTGDVDADAEGTDYHGTFVSGIIAAESNNGSGAAGIARGVQIMPVRTLNATGIGTTEQLAAAVLYAARSGADILNLSLALPPQGGICPNDPIVEAALREAHDELGATIVAAAGNHNKSCVSFPAASQYAIGVSATGPPWNPDIRADFSSWGPEVDVAAPGMEIVSTAPGGVYRKGEGTSFSAPMVSGAAALILSRYPSLTNEQVLGRITQSARDLPDERTTPNWDGSGMLDVASALDGGSAFSRIDIQASNVGLLDLSLVVEDGKTPVCTTPFWEHPAISEGALQGSFGVGACAQFWPPSPERAWLLWTTWSGAKAATLNAWSVRSGDQSCAASGLPAPVRQGSAIAARIDCSVPGQVANDERESAQHVDTARLPQRFAQDARYATSQGDPSVTCVSGSPAFSRSVWYRIDGHGAPSQVVVDTFGSDFPTVLAVYQDTSGHLTPVDCNDDFAKGPGWPKVDQSRLTWRTDGVSSYYVMAAAYRSVPAGRMEVNFSTARIPAHDEPSKSVTIGIEDPYPRVQPVHSATRHVDDPGLSCVPFYGHSVWFEATTEVAATMSVDTEGSDFDVVVGVFEMDVAGRGEEVACGVRTSRVSWQGVAGQRYQIVVGAFASRAADVLRLRLKSE